MVWIIDNAGRRWVDDPPEKRRKPPRVRKFANLSVGDQVMQTTTAEYINSAGRRSAAYYHVSDMWFDPVDGQDDPIKGQWVALVRIAGDGSTNGRKVKIKLRGLASQGYEPADIDYIELCKTRLEAADSGAVVGIGAARAIRARPKVAGL